MDATAEAGSLTLSGTDANQPVDPSTRPADAGEMEFLEERLTFFIKDYKNKRDKSRDLSNSVKIISISVGAIVTILVGLKSAFDATYPSVGIWISAVTLILSAALTSLGAWEAFADHRWKWIRYRATLSALYTIQDDFRFGRASKGGMSVEQVTEFYRQVRNAVHETNQEWMAQRGNSLGEGNKGGEKGTAA
jgi:hypothetical protein